MGYPKRRDDVIGIVHKTLRNKAKGPVENFKGKGWWSRFMQRRPKLALRKGDALAQPRANAVNATKEMERLEKVAKRKRKAEFRLQQKGGKKSTRSCNKENIPSAPTRDGGESKGTAMYVTLSSNEAPLYNELSELSTCMHIVMHLSMLVPGGARWGEAGI